MADSKKPASGKKSQSLIDPIYEKYTRSVIRALASTEFYEFFMDAISKADNEFQFSNRKVIKSVDETWVKAIEECLSGMQNIISNPRNVIREEEIIVNVAHAKKANAEVVRHLAQHGSLVEQFEEDTGDVRPAKLMQKVRDDSTDIYENRLVFTVLESAHHFVKVRHDAIFGAMGDEIGAKFKMKSDLESATELLHMDMFLHIKEKDDTLTTDEKNGDIFARISRLYRLLSSFMDSQFARQLSKYARVKGAIVKTNVLKRNPNYKAIVKLYEFLHNYGDIGYTIRVVEQNPAISDEFQRDIYHNIMFNYIVVKDYLEDEADRRVPAPIKEKKRTIKPKFINQIIEELTEDYDLPDVEIRKVLIEELTKEQLMREEAEERRRLVAEREQRKKEEEARIRAEKKAEQERIRAEKAAEKERIRQEKEAERQRLLAERMERENEERRRVNIFKKELENFWEQLDSRLAAREKAAEKEKADREKVINEDAAKLLSEAELRKKEEAERKKKREFEEKMRAVRMQQLEEQRKREEKLREEEQKRLELEAKMRKEAQEKLALHISELGAFAAGLANRLKDRADYIASENARLEKEAEERRLRRERQASGGTNGGVSG